MKNSNNFTPVAVYENPEIQKDQIYSENKGKSGIYLWRNKINGKCYIGSSLRLSKRLSQYFSKKLMKTKLSKGKSAIYSGILKHGFAKFKLEILVYCSQKKNCIKLEQKYINLLKPSYNLLKIAGSCLGSNRSEESRAKISGALKGNSNAKNHPNSLKIEVTDLEKDTSTIYNSMREAAKALNIHVSIISRYFSNNQKKPYKKRYVFIITKET